MWLQKLTTLVGAGSGQRSRPAGNGAPDRIAEDIVTGELVRQIEERYKLAAVSGGVVVWDWDLEASEFYVDPLLKSILGYEDYEIGNHFSDWIQLVHPDDVKFLLERLHSSLDGGITPFEAEHRFVRKDGAVRWFVTSGRVVGNNQGTAVRMIGSGTDITRRKLAEQELQLVSTRLQNAQDQERRRIARDLHDGTSQNLCAVLFGLQTLESKIDLPPDLQKTVSDCKTFCMEALEEIRTVSYALYPPVLDLLGLNAALRGYVERFSRRAGIDVKLTAASRIERFPKQIETDLFRIVQECLANIQRHSGSRTAQVRLEFVGNEILLQVEDQGRGMPAPDGNAENPAPAGLGLSAIAQRLRYLGGRMEIKSNRHGTIITAVIPLPGESEGADAGAIYQHAAAARAKAV